MPLYEYRCKQCAHQFEKIQSFSAPEEKVCPVCGGEVERLISAPAVQFKGSGWYVTDYAGKSKSGGSKPPSSEKSESSGEKTAPAETKAASSSDKAPSAPAASPSSSKSE